jgi:hypothetical protein
MKTKYVLEIITGEPKKPTFTRVVIADWHEIQDSVYTFANETPRSHEVVAMYPVDRTIIIEMQEDYE